MPYSEDFFPYLYDFDLICFFGLRVIVLSLPPVNVSAAFSFLACTSSFFLGCELFIVHISLWSSSFSWEEIQGGLSTTYRRFYMTNVCPATCFVIFNIHREGPGGPTAGGWKNFVGTVGDNLGCPAAGTPDWGILR